ncbi:DNA gyrase/topoisomerase IV subunit A [Agilicoccus flavus]|uniref:DNA gyrase/topoisomerase IV subunit A n=1 Tax=Agilicoccus flavus TaxID=2775968 RepID=UPI001CF6935B|nr:DNA topoisomerase IV subunit A [Agilicoccus flavus]
MARRRTSEPTLPDDFEERIVDIDVEDEMQGAFLEYAYSVIYSRALPDARDGLKPVQRRILYGMHDMGLRPDRGHVKSSRIVGDVMGKYHPHGDGAIYDALVRVAQPFTMRLPLVDGHGNFGSLDDGPAASRYTEARMAPAALQMVAGLDEDTVDFVPNYDDQLTQPGVLPAAFPNLLVNGAAGIAVGMATNMPPHNLVEVIGAARHLIDHPDADLDAIMRFVPGPDLPGGGRIIGLDGIRDAYRTGRGTFRTRATCRIENITPRKKGIVVTELPYLVGPEKVTTKIQELVRAKKLQGISGLDDFTDGKQGLRLVIEVKNGFNPEAVLEKLYRLTPLEDSFGINNVALVEGRPQTLGLLDLLRVYVDFRIAVVRRRTQYRLRRKENRLHLVEGLLVAILDIDEVIQLIRGSDDAGAAKARLIEVFDLSDAQAEYILELQLRRLTKFSRIELEKERDDLVEQIVRLREILGDDAVLRGVVSAELAEVAAAHGTPRRTVLLESAGGPAGDSPASAALPLEVGDDPCWVLLSSTGLLARTSDGGPLSNEGGRGKHDAVVSAVRATARGEVGLLTSAGRVVRLSVLDLPALPPTNGSPHLSGGAPLGLFTELAGGERALGLTTLSPDSIGLALGTRAGVVKRVTPDVPAGRDDWEVIGLRAGDEVVGAVELATGNEELVFVTSDAQLLRFGADKVRAQGRPAGGVAGIKLAADAHVVFFGAVGPDAEYVAVVTGAGPDARSAASSLKVTPFAEYPAKGRATGGVRCHRFVRGEVELVLAWVGPLPARAASSNGVPRTLPPAQGRRDGSGAPLDAPIAAVAGAFSAGQTSAATPGSPTPEDDDPAGADTGGAAHPGPGLATDPGGLFDLPPATPRRPRPKVDREDYDPDSLDDVVQTGDE